MEWSARSHLQACPGEEIWKERPFRMNRRDVLAGASAALLQTAFASLESLAAVQPRARGLHSTYNVLAFGAVGDGSTKDTQAIQRAVDACGRRGGGRVILPAGHTFVSGTVSLRNNVDLHLESGATLLASPDRDDFRHLGALLIAERADGITVSGSGAIDGNFHAFLKDRDPGGYRVVAPFLGPYDPLYDASQRNPPDGRPRMILLVGAKGARLVDFTIRNSPTWTVHALGCEDLRIANLTVRNDLAVPNCDCLDIDHCRKVRIENCDLQAGDDCIVLKTSRNFAQFGPCENVAVSNCLLQSSSAAIKVEPEGAQTIRQVTMTGCTIEKSNRGIAILNRDGALIEDLVFSNMAITTELKPAMWWGAGEPIQVSNLPRSTTVGPGTVRDIQFSNMVCKGENGIYLRGWPASRLQNITLDDIDLTLEKTSPIQGGYYDLRPGDVAGAVLPHTIAGIFCEQAMDLTLRGINLHWQGAIPEYYGPALEAHDVDGLAVQNFVGTSAHPDRDAKEILQNVTPRSPSL